jgi:3-keto-disaccharide hydrolase
MIGPAARRCCVALGMALALASLAPVAPGTPSAMDRDSTGWTDLLAEGGPDLKGWTRTTLHPTDKLGAKSQWAFDPSTGILLCEGNGGHDWLRWDKELGDFVYHVEWKFTPVTTGKKAYNSGIYVRNSGDAKVWHQAQVGGGPDAFLFGETFTKDGELKRINFSKNQADKRVRPAGEWNVFEVTCKGKEVSLWVNGEVINEWHDCEVARGFVGLEAEGYRIEFRNVKVKVL